LNIELFLEYILNLARITVQFSNCLWCRLFQLNIDISQKKFYRQISSQLQNISPPLLVNLIGHGQVGFSLKLQLYISEFWVQFSNINSYWFCVCSCVLFVWSITDYRHYQGRAPQFSSFYYSALCCARWNLCCNRCCFL
jgi:hypothetical protein